MMDIQRVASFCIRLEDLRFFSRIGVFDQERLVGNEFSVDCCLEVPAENFRLERLDSSISYSDIFDLVSTEMTREWKLLESVALEIANKCRAKWPAIFGGYVKITKLGAPIPGIIGSCSVEYKF